MIDPSSFPSKTASLNGTKYFYIDQAAQGPCKGTIVLVHGWPDSWYGWRYQIPVLSQNGYRVLCISQVGFGNGTETPKSLEKYGFRSVCADLRALLDICHVKKAIFWGHDWGGAVIYRMANYHPDRVAALMAVSTPYFPPAKGRYQSLEEQAKVSPNFGYQVYLASGQASQDFSSASDFRRFFNLLFQPGKGMKLKFQDYASVTEYKPTTLMSEQELEVYVQQYTACGLDGNTNWYRTRRINYDDDQTLLSDKDSSLHMPVLFIATELDPVLKPEYSRNMEQFIPNMTRRSVKTGHWGLVEAKDQINEYAIDFLRQVELQTSKSTL